MRTKRGARANHALLKNGGDPGEGPEGGRREETTPGKGDETREVVRYEKELMTDCAEENWSPSYGEGKGRH